MRPPTEITPEELRRDPVLFADSLLPLNEKREPWRLSPYQRRVLQWAFPPEADALRFRTLVWSEPKKSGKTLIGAVLALWWAFTHRHTEVIICANDFEQAVGRVFKTMVDLIAANRGLGRQVKVLAEVLRFENGTVVTAIASDYKGAAGSRHSLYVVDEPWGIMEERAERLLEELTPPPTEPNAWGLMTTTAGWVGESLMLERLYQRGLAGLRVDDELECYESGELFMFWSHVARQVWQTDDYYAEQRRILRPGTFARLHENRWVASESTFITPELWDECVDDEHHPLLPDPDRELFVGVDASTKHDTSAVVAVYKEEDWLTLACHRLWTPGGEALDLEETIELYLRQLHRNFRVTIICDPFQMHRSIMTLQGDGLRISEFPQTVSNTVRMGSTLFELLKGQNLRLYPDADLRRQALSTVAVESPRGFRIAKEKASKKIDAIVALSMACVAALDQPAYVRPELW